VIAWGIYKWGRSPLDETDAGSEMGPNHNHFPPPRGPRIMSSEIFLRLINVGKRTTQLPPKPTKKKIISK